MGQNDELGYVLVEGKRLRSGYTTGTCAAMAARGAMWMLVHQQIREQESLTLPPGVRLTLSLVNPSFTPFEAAAGVVKDGGDDPDITSGLIIYARVRWSSTPGVQIVGGPGVGKVTKPGLQIRPGEEAINPVPRQMIADAVEGMLAAGRGVTVEIFVPGGEEIARKTFNPQLGILGGISILGTTGIVKPMSEEAYRVSLALYAEQLAAEGEAFGVLVPGNHGEKLAVERYGVSPKQVIKTSNFLGFMLETCVNCGLKEVLLIGHLGKLVKVAAGIFHTANRVADARQEILTGYAALFGAERAMLERIFEAPTTDAVVELLAGTPCEQMYPWLVERIATRCEEYVGGKMQVGVSVFAFHRGILAESARVKQWQREGRLQ